MPTIVMHGRPLDSLFELVGGDENAMTAALGWCLAHVPGLLSQVAAELGCPVPGDTAVVSLQKHRVAGGFTDIEVEDAGVAAWIIEAKQGFEAPQLAQLENYAVRLTEHPDAAAHKVLAVLARSDRKELWLKLQTPTSALGIPVKVLSWAQIIACARRAYPTTDNTGKALLRHLTVFLEKGLNMQVVNSNETYVVSVNNDAFSGGPTTFIDVVVKFGKYFHPVGERWPASPPNYIAFRWDGRLQSVHHVDSYEVITDFGLHFPGITQGVTDPHFLYHLGPAIRPAKEVRTGALYQASRIYTHIDLLLTSDTIAEAGAKYRARLEAAK